VLAGLAACLVASSQVQAQQYLYYPSSGAAQPTYYYAQPTYGYLPAGGFQYYQPSYGPQYYQYSYAPQYAPATQPAQTAQATADGRQVIPASYAAPAADAAPAQPAAAAPASGGSDPYGFLPWLNSVRASYGLSAVGYDQNLSNWAAQNNNAQMAQGLGHFVMGPARRQNSAMGAGFPGAMWMASPAHSAALLDPTISWIGIAAAGAYWTFNAY
jgi:hypothetical protein